MGYGRCPSRRVTYDARSAREQSFARSAFVCCCDRSGFRCEVFTRFAFNSRVLRKFFFSVVTRVPRVRSLLPPPPLGPCFIFAVPLLPFPRLNLRTAPTFASAGSAFTAGLSVFRSGFAFSAFGFLL